MTFKNLRTLGPILVFVATLSILTPQKSTAAVTLLDQNEWKVMLGGFAETDIISDSVRSLTEVSGSTAIDRPGTYAGDNGRTQFSVRNSRFAFTVLPPLQNDWKTKGYLEFDLLGYDPSPSTSAPTNSEASFFTNPSLRVRHAYLSAETGSLQILVGQSWSLLGWEPSYVLSSVSVAPVTGTLYQRTPQALFIYSAALNDTDKLQFGLSFERPTERDSDYPNVDAGIRYVMGSRLSGFSAATGEIGAEPLSVAASGSYRSFLTPNSDGVTTDASRYYGGAVALNALVPILASSDGKDTSNTLTATGEYTAGSGYSDSFPSFTGNLAQLANGTTTPTMPNLDAGLASFDTSGNFQLIRLQSWNAQAQYHLPQGWNSFVTAGYGQLYSLNMINFTANTPTGKVLYDRSDDAFINLFHDFTKQLRVGLELDRMSTHYVDGVMAYDNRYQVSAWLRF